MIQVQWRPPPVLQVEDIDCFDQGGGRQRKLGVVGFNVVSSLCQLLFLSVILCLSFTILVLHTASYTYRQVSFLSTYLLPFCHCCLSALLSLFTFLPLHLSVCIAFSVFLSFRPFTFLLLICLSIIFLSLILCLSFLLCICLPSILFLYVFAYVFSFLKNGLFLYFNEENYLSP